MAIVEVNVTKTNVDVTSNTFSVDKNTSWKTRTCFVIQYLNLTYNTGFWLDKQLVRSDLFKMHRV